MQDNENAYRAMAVVADDIHLNDPNQPYLMFRYNQTVKEGWITINDLTVKFFQNGRVIVELSPYVSQKHYLRLIFSLRDQDQVHLVDGIFTGDFHFENAENVYLPGQSMEYFDNRCPPALRYARWLWCDWDVIPA